MHSYWLEANTTLYHEKQPDVGFIPRMGLSFTSVEVFTAKDVRDAFFPLQAVIWEHYCNPTKKNREALQDAMYVFGRQLNAVNNPSAAVDSRLGEE